MMIRKHLYLRVALFTLAGLSAGRLLSVVSPIALAAVPSPPSVQWTNTFGGTGYDSGQSVQPTADGGYIICGTTFSSGSGNDVYLIKTDASGNMTWNKTFGGAGSERGYSVLPVSDGGYIITGWTRSGGAGGWDVYLIKTDASGNLMWSKPFGGENDDWAYSIQQTADGGYIIVGGTGIAGAISGDVYLIKTDASGNLAWSKTYDKSTFDEGYSIRQTTDSGFIIIGMTLTANGSPDDGGWLIKTDAYGTKLWENTFSGSWRSVQQTPDGGYIITGHAGSDVSLLKTNASGNLTWSRAIGGTGEERGNSVLALADGGYLVAGQTNSAGAGNVDVYLIKTDATGNVTWNKTIGGINNDVGYSVQPTADGGYIIAGDTLSFGIGGDVYLVKLAAPAATIVSSGDANSDGVVNALDITKTERIIAGLEASTPGADANKDGNIDAIDLTRTERLIAGLDY